MTAFVTVSAVVFNVLILLLIAQLNRKPLALSRFGTPMQYWYAFDKHILNRPSVKRYRRDERYVTHDAHSFSLCYIALTSSPFSQLGLEYA